MAVTRTPNWDRVGAIIANLSKDLDKARRQSIMRFGLKAEGLATTYMSDQSLPWAPLSADYLDWKKRKNLSDNILTATSTYFQSITSWVDGQVVYVGVKRTAKDANGNDIANIAAIHEFGSAKRNIPARPLWRIVLKETMIWHKAHNNPVDNFLRLVRQY